jgi:HK97 family phage major capsid protein
MELKELKAKRARLAEEIRSLADAEHITASQDQHLSRLVRGLDKVDAEIKEATDKVRSTVTHKDAGVPTYWRQTSPRDVFETESRDNTERSELAKRAADFVETETGFEVRSDVVALFDKNPDYADVFRATSSKEYRSAWAKIVCFGEAGALLKMTDAERDAVARVANAERRGMTVGSDSAGGFAVPTTVSPEVLLNNSGSVGNLRNLARVVTTTTEKWRGLASVGVTAAFTPEGSEVADGTPTLLGPLVEAHKASCFIPFSFELSDDWEGLASTLFGLMADAKDRLEVDKFVTGNGTNEPYGLLTRLESNTGARIVTTTAGTVGAVDLYSMMAAVPPRFRPNSSWHMEMSTLNRVRQINTDGTLGTFVADLRAGYGYQLLGRPVYENTAVDPLVNSTAAGTFAVCGDISKAYTVVDRVGSLRVSMVPHLFGTSRRPTGEAGMYAYWRVGGDVLTGSTSGECGARILINKTS